ncbi:integrase [Nostoc linckia z18]|uniref:Integrase n=2 Tax=Nostoc linckia TaxID=92942 RepID=A0A9Q5ZGP6_NOSLI|nr:site-specific integrase [Nostoc linckia]PHK31607.1 integrase [Nostoc linckia z15]PHK40462.1 integrase [Nostoc linckia z16]PHJ55765.1 integrase [Nostoc linckia z1]PHJ57072.1 integrase [Nostoc linckia z3]PHJ57529.1 integrase [Nostoc linckia z2]
MPDDKWISRDARTGKLIIRFRVPGFIKQFYLNTGLQDSETNWNVVRSRKEIIERDIALGRFDCTLESYKFCNYKNIPAYVTKPLLHELWAKFVVFQSQQLEQSTIEGSYKQISNIVARLPTQSLDDAAIIRDELLSKYSYHSAYKTLLAFSKCCQWGVDSSCIDYNPFEKIQLAKPKRSSKDNEIKAYTLDQRDLIIEAFESHSKFSHYSGLIKFLFWTGCRPGEAFALTWDDVSDECTRISISKSYASRVHLLKGTKNNKRRVFPCRKGSKLQSLLLNIRPDSPDPRQLIFEAKSGQRLNLRILEKCWRAHDMPGYRYNGVVTELADRGLVPYLSAYSTRHTFATWAIASGASPEKVAYWIGDNVQTVLTYYCHPDVTRAECPDF